MDTTHRHRIAMIVAVFIALFCFVAIQMGQDSTKGNGSDVKSDIKIGLVGPFTGNSAIFGDFMQRGLVLAESKMTDEEKKAISIIKEDDMCNAQKAISAVQKLITVDRVKYIIGPLCNEAVLATENLFEENKVISINIGLPSNKIANMGPYHFSFSPEIEYLMKTISTEMIRQKLDKVAVIHMNGPFETENYTNFIKHFNGGGGVVVVDESKMKGSSDFRDALIKIKAKKPNAIMIIAHTAELNSILKQLNELGMGSIPKFGIHAAETPVLLGAKEVGEGLIYPYPADKTSISSAAEYSGLYMAEYHTSPDPSSSNVYDSLNILLAAIKKCGYEDSGCVLKVLANTKNYPGANGNLSVDGRGVGTYKEIMLKTLKAGTFQSYVQE